MYCDIPAYQSPFSPPVSPVSAEPHQSGQVCWSFLNSKLKTKQALSELTKWVSNSWIQPIELRRYLKESQENRQKIPIFRNIGKVMPWSRVRAIGIKPVLVTVSAGLLAPGQLDNTAREAPLLHTLIHQCISFLASFLKLWNTCYQKLKEEIVECSNISRLQYHLPLNLLQMLVK